MTMEEAIKILNAIKMLMCHPDGTPISDGYEALDMAIEALSAEAVPVHNDGTLEVKVPYAHKVGRVLVMDTESHIGGGLFYPDDAVQWIPCSERLPKVDEEVLTTTDWSDVLIAWLKKGGAWETDEYILDSDEVLAWMPLPEPYRGADMRGADDVDE